MLWLSSGTAAFNTGWSSVIGNAALEPGSIYHLVGTYDAKRGVTLYVNGREVSSAIPGFQPKPQIGDFGGAAYIGVLDAEANRGISPTTSRATSPTARSTVAP